MEVALSPKWEVQVSTNADVLLFRNLEFALPLRNSSVRGNADCRWSVNLDELPVTTVRRQSSSVEKRSLAADEPIMPITSGSQSLLASLPTFMSVFGDGTRTKDASIISSPAQTAASSLSGAVSSFSQTRRASYNQSLCTNPDVHRRDSSTTLPSDSTESSPTTTISTVDSTLTEPSPSSSPESPGDLLPNSSLSDSRFITATSGADNMYRGGLPAAGSPGRPGYDRCDSPYKRPRNMKNLSVNTKTGHTSSLPRLASSDASNALHHASSAPASPSLITATVEPKRKPSNLGLSIATHHNDVRAPMNRGGSDIVPQTPSFARLHSLRQTEGLGNMPLFSPVGAPEGGMCFPSFGGASNKTIAPKTRPALSLAHHASFDSTHSSPIVLQTLDHVPEEADHDLPLSRETKSPAYPHGPVCIYPPSVFLYLEPNDIEASEFDVIINVAREVINPFEIKHQEIVEPKTRDVGVQVDLISGTSDSSSSYIVPEPPSAISEKSFRSAFESLPSNNVDNLDTPKPAKSGPEYIHVPWEHNTKVSLELFELCELIDDRVKNGKRVLVHCQCGVSRSASLIIAYGLYKNPGMSDSDAYNLVKERSRWINPNMHFIFELHAFKQMLAEKVPPPQPKRRPGVALGLLRTQTDSVLPWNTNPISAMSPVDEPSSAPLENDFDARGRLSRSRLMSEMAPKESEDTAMIIDPVTVVSDDIPTPTTEQKQDLRSLENDEMSLFSPSFASSMMKETLSHQPESRMVDRARDTEDERTSRLALPSRASPEVEERSRSMSPPLRPQPSLPAGFNSIVSRRPFTRALPFRVAFPAQAPAIRPTHINYDCVMDDTVPQTPMLLSPRAAEFTATPFHRTAAGDLAGSSVFEQALLSPNSVERDPRSPPTRGEAPIIRSIDDIL
ncbi:hypothetical protein MMC34_006515 [Xylographa carneopallida]|nr:hypothetical protein [Xylographa carneopallida]